MFRGSAPVTTKDEICQTPSIDGEKRYRRYFGFAGRQSAFSKVVHAGRASTLTLTIFV
jgi:hypothetical protein